MFNIYITGVGGQGIGLLSEAIIRAADYAGLTVRGVDTHGLAQRGGIVVSFVRTGNVNSPMFMKGEADLAVSLERNEALRALRDYSKNKSSVIYYNTSWQPLYVRTGKNREVTCENIENYAKLKNIRVYNIFYDKLKDIRMQNIAVLAAIYKNKLIPDIKYDNYINALNDLLDEKKFVLNRELFDNILNA